MRQQRQIVRLAGAAIALAALALPLHRAQAQDTTSGQAPQGYRAMERDSSGDTSAAIRNTAAGRDAAGARDSIKPGEATPRAPSRSSSRMHPGSDTAAAAAAGTDTMTASGDTLGMPGRHQADSTHGSRTDSLPADRPSGVRDQSTSGADSTR